MDAIKATEPRQDSRPQYKSYGNLDDRYGKIGISAVAAAVRHQGELRNGHEPLEFGAIDAVD